MVKIPAPARTRLDDNGRIVIPAAFREALHLKPGDELTLQLDSATGELRALSAKAAIDRSRQLVRRYVPADRSLVQELLNDRRSEAERE